MIVDNLLTEKIARRCPHLWTVCSALMGRSTPLRLPTSDFPKCSFKYRSYSSQISSENIINQSVFHVMHVHINVILDPNSPNHPPSVIFCLTQTYRRDYVQTI